jgi:hypothetical protein
MKEELVNSFFKSYFSFLLTDWKDSDEQVKVTHKLLEDLKVKDPQLIIDITEQIILWSHYAKQKIKIYEIESNGMQYRIKRKYKTCILRRKKYKFIKTGYPIYEIAHFDTIDLAIAFITTRMQEHLTKKFGWRKIYTIKEEK